MHSNRFGVPLQPCQRAANKTHGRAGLSRWTSLLTILLGLSVAVESHAQCPATPDQIEGPFYRLGSPETTDLVIAGDGPLLTVRGSVLDTDCQPIPNCWVDVWHADVDGDYDNSSPDFRYRGNFLTDDDGNFELKTIVPGLYPGRTPHLHFKVEGENTPLLTTQLYLPDHPLNPTDPFFDATVEMAEIETLPSGELIAAFDFHMPSTCTAPTVQVDPVSTLFSDGDTVSLSIEGTGSMPLEYQWRRDGVALVDGAEVSGSSTDSLVLTSLAADEAGVFDCVVTNGCGESTSAGAQVLLMGPMFTRGDCNMDAATDIGDPVFALDYNFGSGPVPGCLDACDVNDDGALNLADPIYELTFLFAFGPEPGDPYPLCGIDPTADGLDCDRFLGCP